MRRLDFVDSLRGLAAIYIVAFHTARVPTPNLTWIEKPGMRAGKRLIARLSAGYSLPRVGTTAPAP